jgi:uncharacterized damage-inducible protein DinB
MNRIDKPNETEYPAYASMYINLVPDDGLVLQHLSENFKKMQYLILSFPEESLLQRYAEGKWTLKEMLVHIIDDERIYVYRALRFGRNDSTELPGFEQDDFALYSRANDRTLVSILEEYETVRKATLTLFKNLPDEAFAREGVANKNKYSVRALIYHIAGHELHHMHLIEKHYLK